MRYSIDTKGTDIIMCNSKNLGALIVKDEPHVKSWDEPQYSIHNIGIEESYGFGVLNEGQAIAVIKNVKVTEKTRSFGVRAGDAIAIWCRRAGRRGCWPPLP